MFVHAEHRDGLVPSHNRLEIFVADDLPLVIWVLEVVGPDVVPERRGDGRTGEGGDADDGPHGLGEVVLGVVGWLSVFLVLFVLLC